MKIYIVSHVKDPLSTVCDIRYRMIDAVTLDKDEAERISEKMWDRFGDSTVSEYDTITFSSWESNRKEEARISGLSKLTTEERESLGL